MILPPPAAIAFAVNSIADSTGVQAALLDEVLDDHFVGLDDAGEAACLDGNPARLPEQRLAVMNADDGGIDLAYLERGEIDNENVGGDTWYVVQSKYGSSFQGANTLLQDGQKIIETLAIGRQPLTEISGGVTERIRQFLNKA